jgi:hypothetical protein
VIRLLCEGDDYGPLSTCGGLMSRVEVESALLIRKPFAAPGGRPPMRGPACLDHGPGHVTVIKGSPCGLSGGRTGDVAPLEVEEER